MAEKVKPPTLVVTGKHVRMSYTHVFQPKKAPDSDKEKYSVSLIIEKKDVETIKKVKLAIEAAKTLGKESKPGWKGKWLPTYKMPLRDGDTERPDDAAYKGCYFINASSDNKPGVVDSAVNAIISADEFYAGCYGRAEINFYPFDTNGAKGVACGLNHLQKISDGEPLSARGSAEDAFGDDNDEEEEEDGSDLL